MTEIADTGERILLEKESAMMIARHFCAYRFYAKYVAGRNVLDIGCGEGYGSNYLAEFARRVTAIDYDKQIIDYAGSKYNKDNLTFLTLDVREISSLKNKFDVICSFQVIEHINNADTFLEEINNLLAEGGIFICSTPNRLDASPGSQTPLNKFHIREYLWGEFKELLERHFKEVGISGLKRGSRLNFYRRLKKIGIFNFLPKGVNPVRRFYDRIDCHDFSITTDNLTEALDFIAVCRK